MATPSYLALATMFGQLLYSGILSATTGTAVYTVAGSSAVKLSHGTMCNTTGRNRTVSDGATTNGQTTVTSASANFTAADVGKSITGAGIQAGATIASVTNSTTIVLSATATATATGITLAWGFAAAVVNVSVGLHKSGDVSDGTHDVISQFALPAGETLSLKEWIGGAMLGAGEAVYLRASVANVITATLSGAVSS